MESITGSSNPAHGLCCKPDFIGEHCDTDADTICSPAALPVKTGKPNFQIFMYNPLANHWTCGLADDEADEALHDMNLVAVSAGKSAYINDDLLYIKEGPEVEEARYDACFFIIKADEVSKNGTNKQIVFKLKEQLDISVYIYEGTSRTLATTSLTGDSGQAELGKEYTVTQESGIVVVAFPTKDATETDILFEFWKDDDYVVKTSARWLLESRVLMALMSAIMIS